MRDYDFDIVVIGSGPGGYVAAARAAQLGMKCACIEKYAFLGGTCLNVGCIPSKTLLYSSHLYSLFAKDVKTLGIETSSVGFNWQQMQLRKNDVVKGLTDGVFNLLSHSGVTVIQGVARFLTPHEIEVRLKEETRKVSAKKFIIATGSEPFDLPFLPIDEIRVVSSTGALSLKEIPKRLVVVGGGVIGVELASVYQRLGSSVAIVEMLDRICPNLDVQISRSLLQILKKQGIQFYLSHKLTKADKQKNGSYLVTINDGSVDKSLDADVVLVCVGRRPKTRNLNLNNAGITVDKHGFIPINDFFQTSTPHIYAIGDVVEGPMLAHKATEEALSCVDAIAGLHTPVNYTAIPSVVYTDPEAASTGFTEEELKQNGRPYFTGQAFFKGNPRARCCNDTEGFVKIIGDKSTLRLLGMHIIGPQASELIAEGVMAITMKATVGDIAHASHAHPTLAEAIREAALKALGRPLH